MIAASLLSGCSKRSESNNQASEDARLHAAQHPVPATQTVGERMMEAANNGDVEHITAILKVHPELLDALSEGGLAPLHWAARGGYLYAVELLLSKEADVNIKDKHGARPLHYAAAKGPVSVVELMLAHGADVNAKSDVGGTALHEAAAHGQKEIVDLLVTRNADVNAKTNAGETPLSLAIREKDDDVATLLRQNGGHQ